MLNVVPQFFGIRDENGEGDDEQTRGDQDARGQKDIDQHWARLSKAAEVLWPSPLMKTPRQ